MIERRLSFLLIGVQKSATTTLNRYLKMHPDIGIPEDRKELHYFDKPCNYSQGPAYYAPFFQHTANKSILGESTPIYCYWSGVIDKIHQYNPDMKLLLSLRNPIDRAYSHWNMEFTHGRENLPFYDALLAESKRLNQMPNRQHRVYSYVDRGRYVEQIKYIRKIFGNKNLHILNMDDLIAYPNKTMNRIFHFLGLEALDIQEDICLYSGKYASRVSVNEKKLLVDSFETEILTLEKLLGWDCRDWLDT